MSSHSAVIPRFRPPNHDMINRLSNEILELIFSLSVPPSLREPVPGSGAHFVYYMDRAGVLDYPTLLALVCRRWGAVALSSQNLYSFLFVDAEDEGALEFKQAMTYYAAYLARSGSRPLTLSIRGLQNTCINLLAAAPFRDHLPRLKWACIDTYVRELMCNFEEPNGYDVFPLFPGVETPVLETVHVDLAEDQGMATFGGTYHLFRRLKQAVEDDAREGDTGGQDGTHEGNMGEAGAGEDNASADDNSKIVRHAPRLLSFSMDRFDFEGLWTPLSLKKAGLDYAMLTCLRLSYVQLRVADWLEFLAKLPLLEIFSCRLLDTENEEGSEQSEGGMSRPGAQSRGKDDQAGGEEKQPRQLTLPYLTELSLFSDLIDNILCTYPPDARTGTGKFLDSLVLPSLKAFAFKTDSFQSDFASDSDIDDEDQSVTASRKIGTADDENAAAKYEDVAAEKPCMTYDKFLLPALRGLIQRSGCEVQALTFDVPYMDLRDLVRILRILPELRALHLDLSMVACEDDLLERLARRTAAGELDLVPKLTHLVLDNYERDLHHPQRSVPLRELLWFVGERWPAGWTDWQIASVRVVVKDMEELEGEWDGAEGDEEVADDEGIANEDAVQNDEGAVDEEQVADDEEASDVEDVMEEEEDEEGPNDQEGSSDEEGSDEEGVSDEGVSEEEEVSNEEEVPVDAEEAGRQSLLVELIEGLRSLRARGDIDLVVGGSTAELYC